MCICTNIKSQGDCIIFPKDICRLSAAVNRVLVKGRKAVEEPPRDTLLSYRRHSLPTSMACPTCGSWERISLEKDASITQLLSCNKLPSSSEETYLRQRLEETKQHKEDLIAAINAAKMNLESLERDKVLCEQLITEYTATLAPIRRVPVEVITEIIDYAVASEDTESLDVLDGVWSLARVCSPWRAAIHHSPQLWANIKVTQIPATFVVPILLTLLSYTKTALLNINFTSHFEMDLSKILLEMLCSQSSRWKNVVLNIPWGHWSALRQVTGNLQQLASLRLSIAGSSLNGVTFCGTCDFFSSAPKLRMVALGGDLDLASEANPGPPTWISLPNNQIDEFAFVLQQGHFSYLSKLSASSIKKLTVFYQPLPEPTPAYFTPIILPSVTEFSCSMGYELSAVVCPSLKHLLLDQLELDSDFIEHLLLGLPRQKEPIILTIDVFYTLDQGEDLPLRLFQKFRSVRELNITVTSLNLTLDFNETMTSFLVPLVDFEAILPSLTSLTVDFSKYKANASLYCLIHSIVSNRMNVATSSSTKSLTSFKFLESTAKEAVTLASLTQLLTRAEVV